MFNLIFFSRFCQDVLSYSDFYRNKERILKKKLIIISKKNKYLVHQFLSIT